jgi:protein-S-isoprenylcysteine O-methyltransferase Ste14
MAFDQSAHAVGRGLIRLAVTTAILCLMLFVPAGTINWPRGWAFLVAFIILIVVSLLMLWRLNPEIFAARSRVQPGTKARDHVFLFFIFAGFMTLVPIAALDFRFGWAQTPDWVVVLGHLFFILAFAGQIWSQAVNRHFEPGVRIQQDRGHTVIDTGPYAIVRHPGYTSGSLLAISVALMLGSWWALIPALVVAIALVPRTLFEEETLRAELPGYTEYTQRVKWRWVPGVW